ncbi:MULTISPECIES: carbohydrate ABC transporter permease [Bacillales]|uniref:carbohydrate ABC transporter permease n=1 Tax=Bacillales TaxID=1385 RepID=UPI0006A7DADF|nr:MULTISPECIES: carbohydrate ABC transporter permease [Bacillales]OBZ09188.1 sugar ABC transporter ATP-binding protein [Bacillus sp. FJAT-26390]
MNRRRRSWLDWAGFMLLAVLTVLMLLPMINMLATSLKSRAESLVFPPSIFPKKIIFTHYVDLFTQTDFLLWYKNSFLIGILVVIGTVLSSSFAAFGFARYEARGKGALFALLLATLMLPYPAIMVPQFILFRHLGWMDNILPLVVPSFLGSAYFVFLIRQFYASLSNEVFEAATMDGLSEIRQWWNMALPLSGAVIATAAVFSFIWSWNDLLGQVLYLSSSDKFTLPIGMASMVGHVTRPPAWGVIMGASILAVLPILVLFSVAQKQFVQSIAMTGVK